MPKTIQVSALLALLLSASAPGQESRASSQPPPMERVLEEPDLKKLTEILIAALPPKERDGKKFEPDARKVDQAKADFVKEIERLKPAHGDKLVRDFAGWGEIAHRLRVFNGIKSPSGFGAPQESKLEFDRASVKLEFTYAVVLPQGYDARKKYPLVVCLHDDADGDKEYTGARYLSEVLLKAPKELRDQFIFLAPNLGPKAGGKDVRIEFGDDNNYFNIFRPLAQALQRYAVDVDRIFVEGTGRGAELAANLVAFKPQQWAAASIRSAVPRKPALMTNAVDVPIAYHYRKGGKADNAKDAIKELEAQKAAGLPISLVVFEPIAPAMEQRARAGMLTDPIQEATVAELTYFADKRRRPPPKSFTFTTDRPLFSSAYWARIGPNAEWDRNAKITVSVDSAQNVVNVTVANIEGFRLNLSDAILDLDRPVKVVVNGMTMKEEKLGRSFDKFYANWELTRTDPGYTPCAEIEIDMKQAESQPAKEPGKEPNDGKTGG